MNLLSFRIKKVMAALGLSAALLAFPIAAQAHGWGRDFGYRGGIYYYPDYDWDWGWGGPFGWGGYPGYYYENTTGTVKLGNVSKTDQVYINGSYAGEAKKLGSIHLDPGVYTVTVKNNGRDVLTQQVYVALDKTVKLEVRDKRGTIKFKDAAKSDQVYLNGVYKGDVQNLSSLRLPPGSYHLVITDNGRDAFNRQVYLPTNKTLDLKVGDKS